MAPRNLALLLVALLVPGCTVFGGADGEDATPSVVIASPAATSTLSGVVTLAGTAHANGTRVTLVEVRVDEGPWTPALGTDAWNYVIDASHLAAGPHTLAARASTAKRVGDPVSITVLASASGSNPGTPTPSGGGNRVPLISAGAVRGAFVGQEVSFDTAVASDPDGDALTIDWDFGDGTPHATILHPTHVYPRSGAYNVTFSVSDGKETAHSYLVVTVGVEAKLLWKRATESPVVAVAVSPDGSLVAAANRSLDYYRESNATLVVYGRDGALRWSTQLPAATEGDPTSASLHATALAIADDGTLYVLTDGGRMLGYDAKGALLFDAKLPTSTSAFGGYYGRTSASLATTADGSRAYAAVAQDLRAYDRAGRELWHAHIGNTLYAVAATPDGRMVAVGGDDRYVTTYDGEGTMLHERQLYDGIGGIALASDGSALAVMQGSFGGNVTFLRADGTTTRVVQTYTNHFAAPGDLSALATAQGRTLAMLAPNGARLWSYDARNNVDGIAVSTDGTLVVMGAEDGSLYALDGRPAAPG